jgi:hypothetical protein
METIKSLENLSLILGIPEERIIEMFHETSEEEGYPDNFTVKKMDFLVMRLEEKVLDTLPKG